MKAKTNRRKPPLSASMVEDGATERLKKRLKDLGLIVHAGAGKATKPASKKNGGKK